MQWCQGGNPSGTDFVAEALAWVVCSRTRISFGRVAKRLWHFLNLAVFLTKGKIAFVMQGVRPVSTGHNERRDISMKAALKKIFNGVLFLLLVAAGVAVGVLGTKAFYGGSLFGTSIKTTNTQTIESINRKEQVVLLSLGIQGLESKTVNGEILGQKVPWSENTKFVQYSFYAKLGIEGRDVKIESTDENEYLVTIPEFIFIGHDSPTFEQFDAKSGILSWLPGNIDATAMVNEILNDDAKDEYLEKNKDILESQAEAFYRGIAASLDPDIKLTFRFAG